MYHKIVWKREYPYLVAWERVIPCSCEVRNLENGLRGKKEIVYSMPGNRPYSPKQFPNGLWKVGMPVPRKDEYKAPYFIPTDAHQVLHAWEVRDGEYVKESDELVLDDGYGLHYSVSRTTLGCIKILEIDDLLWLVKKLTETFAQGGEVDLEVT